MNILALATNVLKMRVQVSATHTHTQLATSDFQAEFVKVMAIVTATYIRNRCYSTDQMQGIRRTHFDRMLNAFSAADEHV